MWAVVGELSLATAGNAGGERSAFSLAAFLHHLPGLGFTIVAVRTAIPSRKDEYGRKEGWMPNFRKILKVADCIGYRLFRIFGLDQKAWGPTIEVMARKASLETRR